MLKVNIGAESTNDVVALPFQAIHSRARTMQPEIHWNLILQNVYYDLWLVLRQERERERDINSENNQNETISLLIRYSMER